MKTTRWYKNSQTIVLVISALFMVLFMYTAINKLIDNVRFVHVIQTSPLLRNIAWPVAIFVPLSEIVAFVLLANAAWRLKGLYLSAGLMLIFTVYILIILLTNKYVPCNCGGVIEKMTWRQHFYFNLFFDVLAIVGIILQRKINKNLKQDQTGANYSMA